MRIVGDYHFAADRLSVWRALNDPEVLRRAIPGCETMDRASDVEWHGRVVVRVWPIKATFDGIVRLSELAPPDRYRITIEADAPLLGTAGGSAIVTLTADPNGGTKLTYDAETEIGGRLAQLGGRLVQSAGTKYADKFFARFAEAMDEVEAEKS
ncbi:CoxG family protein [Roseiterribacter gracilis]|uniref:Carbon monoxide dehydrogenase n=1 Tax=Roseiterribacter gracilis TaxID=2812848 RepID=A0A8S8XAL9_9PROT|nr:carbon monoxide dehydrogenase [Rhodospirillales bacterium TMPK1]